MYNFDRQNINRLNLQIPVPLFFADEPLHFGASEKCELVFSISPNWYSNLIQICGSSATSVGSFSFTVTNKNTEFTANTIN